MRDRRSQNRETDPQQFPTSLVDLYALQNVLNKVAVEQLDIN